MNCFPQILVVNHMCSVTNTKCQPNIVCHSLLKKLHIVSNVALSVTC